MDNRLSIYVSSPDSYADVFAVFYKAYNKYWPDCPYKFILTTNTQRYEGINCICNNKPGDSWVERTLAAIPYITSKYILMMCDDLIISDKVVNSRIERILDYMDANKMKYCRLKPLNDGDPILDLPFLSRVNQQTPYAINLQIGIFRREFFIELIGDGTLSAWDIENKLGTEASKAEDSLFPDVISVNTPIIPFVHGVYKAKWFKKATCHIKKNYPNYKFERSVLPFSIEMKVYLILLVRDKIGHDAKIILKKIMKMLGVKFATND